jgi:catechol 2,3-dioxygenase-like lactoylglutathione lyase family enzyme
MSSFREAVVSRVQLALNVDDLAESIAFYSKLFGTGPAKQRPGYANFAIAEPPLKLILMENPGEGGSLNHLGVEVADTGTVDAEQTRLAEAGLASVEERDTTCCYARQDKFWVKGAPSGERWEIYTVLADSATFWGQDGAGGEDDASADVRCAAGPAGDRAGPGDLGRLPAGQRAESGRGAGHGRDRPGHLRAVP